MTRQQETHHHHTSKRRKWGRIVGAAVILCLIWLGVRFVAREGGREAAIRTVKQESISQGAGFMGATWLMPMNEVRSLFPNAIEFAPGNLKMEATAFGRPAFVDFMFTDNLLLMIIVSFKGQKTDITYGRTQVLLEQEYGAFPEPVSTAEHTLASRKDIGRIVIEHLLYQRLGIPIEQMILYRTK